MLTSNQKYISIEDLSQKQRNLIGIAMMSMSLVNGYIVYIRPEGLRVPIYIVIVALAVFFVAGLAIFLHGRVTKERYHHLMQSILVIMFILSFSALKKR